MRAHCRRHGRNDDDNLKQFVKASLRSFSQRKLVTRDQLRLHVSAKIRITRRFPDLRSVQAWRFMFVRRDGWRLIEKSCPFENGERGRDSINAPARSLTSMAGTWADAKVRARGRHLRQGERQVRQGS